MRQKVHRRLAGKKKADAAMTIALTLLAATIAAMFVATTLSSLVAAFREEAGRRPSVGRRIFL